MAKKRKNKPKQQNTNKPIEQVVGNSELQDENVAELPVSDGKEDLEFIDISSDKEDLAKEFESDLVVEDNKEKEFEELGENLIELDLTQPVVVSKPNKVNFAKIIHFRKYFTKDTLKDKLKSLKPSREAIITFPQRFGTFLWGKLKSFSFKKSWTQLRTNFSWRRIMNGLSLCSVVILGGLALYSYLFSFPKALDIEKPEEKTTVSQDNYFVDIDVDNYTTEKILWNADYRKAIDNCLSKDTYVKLQQVTSSVNKKGNLANVSLTTDIAVDFATQRLYCVTDMTDNIGNKHSEYFYDNVEGLYLTNVDPDGWIKSQKVAVNVNFELDAFETCADFYKFLLNDFGIKNNTEGEIIEDFVYFDYTRPALDRDLTNINYDKLDDTNIQLVFKKISATEMQPVSMIKQVDFESNENVYSSKLVIMFEDLSHTEMPVPSYKDYLEETYDEVSENKAE